MDSEARLKAYADPVDARLSELLSVPDGDTQVLFEAMRYAVLSPGKRLRPALCMASAFAAGGEHEAALDAGCALELVHCFSLIHDDLPAIDDDALRRGHPTCHVRFGEAMAILAGDALFALAFEVLSHAAPSSEAGLQAVRILAEASGPRGLVGGEVADILAEGDAERSAAVEAIHVRKTGALIRASCEIGALMAGGERHRDALSSYGKHAGLAFQIADDLLNELSTTAAIGKSAGSDRKMAKATYPTVFGVEASKERAREQAEKALAAIETLGERAEDLRAFAGFVVNRLR